MTTRLYTRRRLHDQRRHDPLYLLALITTLLFAITASPEDTRLFTFTIFVPVMCAFITWNELKLMLNWRVEFWKTAYQDYPGILVYRVALITTLTHVAAPAFLIGAMTHHFQPRALWTYAALALLTTLAYTAIAVTVQLWHRPGFIAVMAYALLFENLLCHYFAWPRWLSVREWSLAATELLPTGDLLPPAVLPGAVGLIFLLLSCSLGLLWVGGIIAYLRWHETQGQANTPGSPS